MKSKEQLSTGNAEAWKWCWDSTSRRCDVCGVEGLI